MSSLATLFKVPREHLIPNGFQMHPAELALPFVDILDASCPLNCGCSPLFGRWQEYKHLPAMGPCWGSPLCTLSTNCKHDSVVHTHEKDLL